MSDHGIEPGSAGFWGALASIALAAIALARWVLTWLAGKWAEEIKILREDVAEIRTEREDFREQLSISQQQHGECRENLARVEAQLEGMRDRLQHLERK